MPKVLRWSVGILIVLVLLVGLALALIDEPLRAYMEREASNRLKGYDLQIGKLDLHPIRLSLELGNVVLRQEEHPDPPVAQIPAWSASLEWRGLLRGALVGDMTIERPQIHFTRPQAKSEIKEAAEATDEQDRGWQDAVQAIFPLHIELSIRDADITYRDSSEAKPLHFRHAQFQASNIRNIRSKKRTYPSEVRVESEVFENGRLVVDGTADFLSEPYLGVKADVEFENVILADLVSLVGRYNVQLRQGTLSAKGHVELSPHAKDVQLTELFMDGVRLDYVHATRTGQTEQRRAKAVGRAAEDASNNQKFRLKIARGKIVNSEFGFVNQATKPQYRVFLSGAQADMDNFSNQLREGTAAIKITGKFMGSGATVVQGAFRPETRSPDFDLSMQIVKTQMKSMNDVIRAYGAFDVAQGLFSLFAEMNVKNGAIDGYVKPMFKNVDVYHPAQDNDKGLLKKIYEGVVGGISEFLENEPREEVATETEVSGPVENPQASTWEVVVKLIQNAFFEAVLPGFQRRAG
ncbi:MAG: DUF748 domain-containing protein [Nitrospiraceae bacterium]